MTYFANQDEFAGAHLPSPFGRRAGDEGLARAHSILNNLRDMNSHNEFISRSFPKTSFAGR